MTLLCLCICCSSSGQVNERRNLSACSDILSFFEKGTVTFGFDYAFHERWSAGGFASLPVIQERAADMEETEHESGLSENKGSAIEASSGIHPEYGIGISHWPGKYLEGTYLKLLCRCTSGHGADLALGAGYAAKVFRNFGMIVGYEFNALSIARTETNRNGRISINLFYRF